MAEDNCSYCDCPMPRSARTCPHCARPGRFPNVLNAEEPGEKDALAERYAKAIAIAEANGTLEVVGQFEEALTKSKAVIARPLQELQRLANSDNELYATFYELTESGVRLALDEDWDRRRRAADDTLFTNFHQDVRFACLSLDGKGLAHYGECFLVLKDDMIAHRASLLTENAVTFLARHDVNPVKGDARVPAGHRATWEDRAKLSVAKLAEELTQEMTPEDFPRLLMNSGTSSEEDQFVEVHILDSLTRRSLESVTIGSYQDPHKRVLVEAVREKLKADDVDVEVKF